jgi:hypothetical protein
MVISQLPVRSLYVYVPASQSSQTPAREAVQPPRIVPAT